MSAYIAYVTAFPPTAQQLHPGAGLVDGGGVAEEEQRHAGDAAQRQHHGEQHEHRGRFEGSGWDRAEVGEAPDTCELPAGRAGADAVVEEAEVARLRRVDAVADPVRLDEDHHVDDGEADGEDRPQHPDGAGVAHVVVMVNLGGFLRRQHVFLFSLSPFLSSNLSLALILTPRFFAILLSPTQYLSYSGGGVLLFIYYFKCFAICVCA